MSIIAKKILCNLIIAVFAINIIVPLANATDITNQTDSIPMVQDADNYYTYLENNKAKNAESDIVINAVNYINSEPQVEIFENTYNEQGRFVKTTEETTIDWSVNVPEDAFYNIELYYYTITGNGSAISRELLIDNKIPFKETSGLTFNRIFENGSPITRNNNKNDIVPLQKEKNSWVRSLIQDNSKIINEPYKFLFSKGIHNITLKSLREPMVIKAITLKAIKQIPSYDQYIKSKTYKSIKNQKIVVQGEDANYKSDSSLIPVSDQVSPLTYPSDPSRIRLNTIGGVNWKTTGQWIEWNIHVKESGLYKISINAKQDISPGYESSRALYIDNEILFKEMQSIKFKYSTDYSYVTLQNSKGEDLYIFLEKGNHELKLEANLGESSVLIEQATKLLLELNQVYRKILVITGSSPDIYRDYNFNNQIPEIFPILQNGKEKVNDIIKNMESKSTLNNENIAILKNISSNINKIIKNPDSIASQFTIFSSNITALGSVISSIKSQPLIIDNIMLSSKDIKIPSTNANFFQSTVYGFQKFIASFFDNYNMTESNSNKKAVTVWVGNGVTAGRDQADALKRLSDNNFTPQKKINVNLQLISAGALLPSILSGKSPDVALTVGAGDPMNYAARGAVVDLSKFSDINQVESRFFPSAFEPLKYRGGIYGLPESQNFPIMFYRKDILNGLNLKIPNTWDDVIKMLPELQKKQMSFGLPQVMTSDATSSAALSTFMTFLFQAGGELYRSDGKSSAFDDPKTIQTFAKWAQFYTQYQLPLQYDFANRFRSGEVPIGIADYGTYNLISIFAPELDGLWGFAPVPGTVKENGEIDRSVAGSITACIILKNAKDKNASWEYIKWWTSADTQEQFGKSIESIMGIAARYSTANIEAAYKIPWKQEDFKVLKQQWQFVKGVQEVPGGYVTGRFFDFAFRNAVNNSKDPGLEIINAANSINSELAIKRKEFGIKD